MKHGIDASAAQGTIDWAAIGASGTVDFAIIKCGSGNDYRDAQFLANVAGCAANGIPHGCYHFLEPIGLPSDATHPNRAPREQAKLHFGWSGGLGIVAGELPPWADIEWPTSVADSLAYQCTPAQVQDWLFEYLDQYDQESGGPAMGVYTDLGYVRQWGLASVTGLGLRHFWSANPTEVRPNDGDSALIYPPWSRWDVWQWSWKQRIAGIVDNVDGDAMTAATLQALLTR